MNINRYQNQINNDNYTYQNNEINMRNNDFYYPINNYQENNTNIHNNLYSYDKRLILCLKCLGLHKYIPNFVKKGIKFEDFLSFSNSDLSSLKIPSNIQNIIQKFIISYFNFGSMYTIEEIIQFFKTKKIKRHFPKSNELNNNERNRENRNNIKYKSVNDKRIHNHNNNNYNYSQNINLNKNINSNSYMNNNINNNKQRPKSQKNKVITNIKYNANNKKNIPNSQKMIIGNNYDKNNTNKINNFRTSSKNSINQKNNKMVMYDITTSNSNISSLQSSQNNLNFLSPNLDNFSHMAMKENSPQLLNMIKMAKYKNIKINNNINQLKKNLDKNFSKAKKIKENNNNTNINRNKKIITDNKCETFGLSRSTSKDIIDRMNEVLNRYESRKKSTNSSINLNMTKGYHSDGYLKEKNNMHNQMFNNINNINLEGYEINTYYAGDSSKLNSLYGNDSLYSGIKQIKKSAYSKNSKINKAKKINELQERKIEYLLSHGGNSSLKSNNYLMMNNFDINNDEEISQMTNNKSKDNFTNYTNISNDKNKQLFMKKNNYINQINNNINSIKQKNLLIQRQNYQNKISKNKQNNFNTYSSNRGNISSSNFYHNNNLNENIRLNNNIMHIPNTQNRNQKKEGPVQISLKNRKKNNMNIIPNYNNIKERGNNFNINNNSMNNFSMGIQKNNNLRNYPLNNYINTFININNNQQQPKRNTKSSEKQIKNNRVYAGIHNINNNINNININNINYDGKRLSEGYDNLLDLDMRMNYPRTQNNFYQPNNLLNNDEDYNNIY